jgi:hypothetical protein
LPLIDSKLGSSLNNFRRSDSGLPKYGLVWPIPNFSCFCNEKEDVALN